MDQGTIERVARKIYDNNQAKARFAPLRGDDEPPSLDAAYEVQDALYKIMQGEGGRPAFAGHKIALTSPDIQKMCGVDQPAYGSIFSDTIFQSPHAPVVSSYNRIGTEYEVALRIGRDVPLGETPFTAETIAPYVEAAMPAMEMIDDRDADYADLDAKSILTDRCWCGGIVLGEPVSDWRTLDLGNLKSHVTWNGDVVDHGNTGNALGHPLNGLAWIANHLAKRGGSLKAGEVVMTGSALKTRFPKAGDACTYTIEGLGSVTVNGA